MNKAHHSTAFDINNNPTTFMIGIQAIQAKKPELKSVFEC